MIRKAVKQGLSTIMVSLPKEWITKNNVVKGDPIYLKESGESLLLSTNSPTSEPKEIVLTINTREDYCPRLLTMPYLQGYGIIKVNFKDSAILNEIESEIKYLVGFEIIKTENNSCVIKNITHGIETEFDNMLNRLMNILVFLGKETLNHVNKNDYEDILLLRSAEVESNKLSLLCRRMFNTKLVRDDKKGFSTYTMVTLMEAIADEYRFIVDYLYERKPELSPKTRRFFEQVNNTVKDFSKLFYKFDMKLFIRFREDRQEIQRNFNQFYKLSKDDIFVVNKLFNIVELVHHATY